MSSPLESVAPIIRSGSKPRAKPRGFSDCKNQIGRAFIDIGLYSELSYLFLRDVLRLSEEEASSEAEKIKLVVTDETINKLAKYVHKVLDLNDLNCNYDINKEKCRECVRRTGKK